MKIGIHCQALAEKKLTGIGYSLLYLLDSLLSIDSKNEYYLISKTPLLHLPRSTSKEQLKISSSVLFSYFGFSKAVKDLGCDLVYIPKETVSPFHAIPSIISVYDLYYLTCSKEIRKQIPFSSWMHYQLAVKYAMKKAEHIIAISEDTKKDIIKYSRISPENISVIYPSCDLTLFRLYSEQEIDVVKKKYALSLPYFINVSSVWWERKNLVRVIESFARICEMHDRSFHLVIIGMAGTALNAMRECIRKHHLIERVHLLEYVPREDVPLLLNGAYASIFPSLHEGFGMPIIEAMACGCPVITSNTSAMPEAAGEAALLVEPLSIDSITEAMQLLIEEPVFIKALREKGLKRATHFSHQTVAMQMLKLFERLAYGA